MVHRHRARRLHYDLRLEMDGILASWAVPKGPTLDPSVRRLAIHVDDHELEHFEFEGVIGTGDAIVWDWGSFTPSGTDDPAAAVAAGSLHFDLEGVKLRGRFVLIRTGPARPEGREQWLLLHKRDAAAVDGWEAEDHLRSVKSGLTNVELVEDDEATAGAG